MLRTRLCAQCTRVVSFARKYSIFESRGLIGREISGHKTTCLAKEEQVLQKGTMTGNKVKVSIGQMCATDSIETNIKNIESMVIKASLVGSRMLFLPENAVFMGRSSAESIAMAESITADPNGIIHSRIARLAKENDMWISIGGFQEKTEAYPDSKVHNCHILLDNSGQVKATYRKVHLFDVDIETVRLQESSFTLAGRSLVACENTPIGTIGLSVCYDLRFPEMYQKLRFDYGADVILIPAAFTVPTGQAHWECLLRARAIETQCYVIAAAQCGKHNEKRSSYGHSLIVDPWGEVVGRMEGDQNAPGLVTAEVDASLIEEVRKRMPVAMHRSRGRECLGIR